jgi:hypothetical protein
MPTIKPIAIYLAGPMYDHTGDYRSKDAMLWRDVLGDQAPAGVLFISPAHAFFGASPITAPILDRVERHMIVACHALLANLTDPAPAFGTIRDIEFAKGHGMPVAIASDSKSLMTHDLIVKPTVDEALTALLEEIHGNRKRPAMMMGGIQLIPPIMPDDEGEDHDDAA